MSPARVNFELTGRCNLSCTHCLRDKTLRAELKPALFKKVLKELQDYGIKRVSFTGGEPLLHPHFQELVEYAARAGFEISFVTNGILLPKFIGFLAAPAIKPQLERVCISLDGPDPKTHDKIRGQGSFARTMKGILAAQSRGIPFVIKFTINAQNCKQLEQMALLAGKLGAGELQLSQLYPTPENLRLGLALPPDQWESVQAEASRLLSLLKIGLVFSAGIFFEEAFPTCAHLAMSEYYVDSRGWLCLCCMLGGIAGRDARAVEKDRVANLATTRFVDAHRKLIGLIGWFHLQRLERIKQKRVSPLEHYQCLACGFHFGKLDWLQDFPKSPWAQMLKAAQGEDG